MVQSDGVEGVDDALVPALVKRSTRVALKCRERVARMGCSGLGDGLHRQEGEQAPRGEKDLPASPEV